MSFLLFMVAAAANLTSTKLEDVPKLEEGVWEADILFPTTEPGKAATHAHGLQRNSLRSDGKWMLNLFSVDGSNYEGTGIWGFDRVTGRFSGVWTDNNDRVIRLDDGRWDEDSRTITWTANIAQPDGHYLRLLTTEKFDDKERTFRSVALTRAGEVPLVEIVFTKCEKQPSCR